MVKREEERGRETYRVWGKARVEGIGRCASERVQKRASKKGRQRIRQIFCEIDEGKSQREPAVVGKRDK
ncbi:hypothetical protein KSF_104130 [Reticulibacter mediterranei]|uniref:Uncharacterized protein n=1 Tax=Reticulibacter mediterranei TaxID=2778369 RepID=A0A8J3J121_9CHLR|nr:hypothetical protein KSF_104130 [Reticulibacter mediterranei]